MSWLYINKRVKTKAKRKKREQKKDRIFFKKIRGGQLSNKAYIGSKL